MGLGLFGKLPARGDFVTRAMPPEVLSFWEGWLEKVMGGAKHHLAGEWGQVYEASPVWRFWVGPGVFGHAIAGALAASVDKVGRQFPLTLVLSGEGAAHPVPPLSDPMEAWYGTLERALHAAKSGHFDGDVDGFLAALPAPSAAPCARGEDRRNAFFAYGEHGLGQMLADVRDHDHQLAAFQRSYWWTAGNAHVGPGMVAMDGMPDAMGFAAMLRGFGPPAQLRQAGAAGTGAGGAAATVAGSTGRTPTVPPRDLIGDAEEAEAAAAWGAPQTPGEDLAWAAPSDAGQGAWAEANTGDAAESPFDGPQEAWDFPDPRPDAGGAEDAPATASVPEGEAEPETPEDVFDEGPEPYGIGEEAGEDIYASLSEPASAQEQGADGAPAQQPGAPEPQRAAFVPAGTEGPVIDVSMVWDEDEEDVGEDMGAGALRDGAGLDAPDAAAEPAPEEARGETSARDGARLDAAAGDMRGPEPAAAPADAPSPPAGEREAEEEAKALLSPEDEDSPFGTDEEDPGARKPGLRGLFSRRNRGKD